jgi:YD repeat-containing protein
VSASAQLTNKLDVRTYRVDVKSNDLVSFRWVKTGPFASTTPVPNPPPAPLPTNVQMFIYGPDGVLMTQTSSTATNPVLAAVTQNSANRMSIDVQSPLSGPLTAVVYDSQNNPAAFSISASRLNGACGDRPLICGIPIDTSIKAPVNVEGFVVSAQAGDVFAVRLGRADETGTFRPAAEVYDPAGKLLTNISPQVSSPHSIATGTFTATATGTYTVLAADATDATKTGGYTLTLNRLNRPCSTTALECASVLEGRLQGLLRSNVYSLAAAANDSILLRILNTGENRIFKPRIDVYDPQGNVVQTVNAFDLVRTNFTVPAAGTYTVVVSDAYDSSQSGAYSLASYRLNRPCDATGIECGKPIGASISGPLRISSFSYNAAQGESFAVRLLDSNGLQPDIEVYDPAGQKVGTDASGSTRGVDVVRPPAGSYTIVALDSSLTPGQGSFSLELLRTRNACGISPGKGQSVNGAVTGNSPYVSYSMPVAVGDVFSVRSASYTSGFNALMEVYDHDGARVDQGTYSITRRVASAGTYTVLVSGSTARSTGAYALSWQMLNDPANTSSLNCGSTVAGSLASDSAFRYYQAGLSANDVGKFLLTRSSDNFSPIMELYDPTGSRVSSNTSEISQRLTRAGNYLMVVSPETATGQTGTYSVSLQRPNNPCNATNLDCGQSLLRKADVAGQIEAVTFTGAAGDATSIRLPVRSGDFAPFGELYNETGTLLRGFSSGSLNMQLPASGKYTLFVRDRNGTGLGSYRIALQTDPACTVDDKEAPAITLIRPTGGEVIAGGTSFRITWQSDDNIDVASHEIRLSTDGGKTFPTVIGTVGGAMQSYDWAVPGDIPPTRTAALRVTATDSAGNSQSATTDLLAVIGSGFTENNKATITYDPLGRITGVTYTDGRSVTYTWDAQGNLARISVTGQ